MHNYIDQNVAKEYADVLLLGLQSLGIDEILFV